MQSDDTWMELHALHRHGWSIAALAREFGLDFRTARRYANASEAPRYRPRLRPTELTAAWLAHVERRLAACPDLRGTVLHRELVDDDGYPGSYTSLRRRVVKLRLRATAEPEIRFQEVFRDAFGAAGQRRRTPCDRCRRLVDAGWYQ